MLAHQNEDGGWPIYEGGPTEISASVLTYLSLKLCGYGADHPALDARPNEDSRAGRRDRRRIPTPRFISASSGSTTGMPFQRFRRRSCCFPNWFWFNIYEISSWSRAIFIPLAIVYAKKPFKKIAPEQGIDELFVGGQRECSPAPALGSREDRQLAQFLPVLRSDYALVRVGACASAALDCHARPRRSGCWNAWR